MALRPLILPWTGQPQEAASVGSTDLAYNLTELVTPVTSKYQTVFTGSSGIDVGSEGRIWKNASGGTIAIYSLPWDSPDTQAITIFLRVKFNSMVAWNDIIRRFNAGGTARLIFQRDNANSRFYVYTRSGLCYLSTLTPAMLTDGKYHDVIVTLENAGGANTRVTVYLDGTQHNGDTLLPDYIASDLNDKVVLGENSEVAAFGAYNGRVLRQDEAARFSLWSLFEPRSIWVPVSAGGGGVTGTVAATEAGDDTAALAGTVLVQGAMAAAESGADTAAINGSSTATGTVAATETGTDAAVLSGAVIVQGLIAALEPGADSASVIGQIIVRGSLAASESGSDTAFINGASAVPVSGDCNGIESGSDAASAFGVVGWSSDGYPPTPAATPSQLSVVSSSGAARTRGLTREQIAGAVGNNPRAIKFIEDITADVTGALQEAAFSLMSDGSKASATDAQRLALDVQTLTQLARHSAEEVRVLRDELQALRVELHEARARLGGEVGQVMRTVDALAPVDVVQPAGDTDRIMVQAGSATRPTVTAVGDQKTGLFWTPGEHSMSVSLNGSQAVKFFGDSICCTGQLIMETLAPADLTHHTSISGTSTLASIQVAGTTSLLCYTTGVEIPGHLKVEGVQSTGATGTGKLVFDTDPVISGHPTIEGVTSTGATGSGMLVFRTSPTLVTPNLGTPSAINCANATNVTSSSTVGYSGTVTTASLVGKTITITNGLVTSFA